MPWCSHCSDDRPTAAASSSSSQPITSPDGTSRRRRFISCSSCGRVLRDGPFHDKSLHIATAALNNLNNSAAADDDVIITDAHHLFRTALEKEELFSRGHRARTHVATTCLYISLRRHRKPCMLMDLSDYLKVSVYALGAVFVSLSTVLGLRRQEEEDECCCFIDPCLFMHRISTRLLGRNDAEVASTALRIISITSKKPRDWMLMTRHNQITRLCTAALCIAAIAHHQDAEEGHDFSKSEVARAVRLEFESMRSNGGSGLTMEEFVSRAGRNDLPSEEELVCRHKKTGSARCCYGLCKDCYDVFLEICGEGLLEQSAEPEESLSDLEDYDINAYLNTEREKQYKTTIWELMNKEHLKEQAANKNEAPAVARTSGDGNKATKEGKQRRGRDKGSRDATAEATQEKLKNKRLSSRINYDVLSQLYEEEEEKKKKRRTGTENGGVRYEQNNENKEEEDFDTEAVENYNEAEIYGDEKSAEAEGDEDFGDLEEDYGEGEYNEYFAGDGNEDYADDDDFGF